MSAYFFTYDGVALLLSAAIFLITIFLLSIRTIGFWIALLLLLFSLATGLVVGNMDVIREYFLHPKDKQMQTDLNAQEKKIEQINSEITTLKERVDHLDRPHKTEDLSP